MPTFKSREEYERWKSGRVPGGATPPTPASTGGPNAVSQTPPPLPATAGAASFTRWAWSVETDALHEVVAEFSVTGNEKILVDGRIVFERRSWKLRNEHAFPLGAGHSGRLTVAATLKSATCRLFVHGREVPPHDGPAERPIQFKAPLGSNLAAVIGGVLGLMVVEMNAAQWFPHRGRGINWSRAIWAGIATGAGAGLFQLIWMLIRAAAGKR